MKNLLFLPFFLLIACGGSDNSNNNSSDHTGDSVETIVPDTDSGKEPDITGLQNDEPGNNDIKNNHDIQSNDDPLQAVLGKWKFVKSVCCGRVQTTYPDSLNTTVEFTKEGKVIYYHGTEFYKKLPFKVGMGEIYEDRPYLQIGNKYKGLLTIDGQEMILDFGYMDLHTEYYTRLP